MLVVKHLETVQLQMALRAKSHHFEQLAHFAGVGEFFYRLVTCYLGSLIFFIFYPSVSFQTIGDQKIRLARIASKIQSRGNASLGDGSKIDMTVSAGDVVLYGKYSGTEISINDEDLLIMRESDILGIITD